MGIIAVNEVRGIRTIVVFADPSDDEGTTIVRGIEAMPAQLVQFPASHRPVAEPAEVDVAAVRRALRLDKKVMSVVFGIPAPELARFERGEGKPVGLAKTLLTVAAADPKHFRQSLRGMGLV